MNEEQSKIAEALLKEIGNNIGTQGLCNNIADYLRFIEACRVAQDIAREE